FRTVVRVVAVAGEDVLAVALARDRIEAVVVAAGAAEVEAEHAVAERAERGVEFAVLAPAQHEHLGTGRLVVDIEVGACLHDRTGGFEQGRTRRGGAPIVSAQRTDIGLADARRGVAEAEVRRTVRLHAYREL